jgi:hypothetical protein
VTEYTTDVAVRVSVGLEPADPDPNIADAVLSANAWASNLPHAPADDTDPHWPEFVLGVKYLAARWYKRRFTPEGVGSAGDVPLYVPRRDPDIDQLLRVGPYAPPRVG